MTAPRLAGTLAILATALTVANVAMIITAWQYPNAWEFYARPAALVDAAVWLWTALVGALISFRRPGSSVGWLLLASGMSFVLMALSGEYALRGLVLAPTSLPSARLALVVSQTSWVLPFALLIVILSVYPTGRLLGPGWWWPVATAGGSVALVLGPAAVLIWPMPGGARQILLGSESPDPAVSNLITIALLLLLASAVGGIAATVARWRRSRGVERLQLKWLALAGFGMLVISGPNAFLTNDTWAPILATLGVASMPVAIAIAVFRYRLYDIDRIISRTVGYGLVLAVLGLVYTVGAVWLPTRLLGEQPPVFVAGATLAAAALFNPVRRRTLRAVDRRFYRSRYDSERITEGFTSSLRHQVDPSALADDLAGVVARTLHPSAVGVWVRETS